METFKAQTLEAYSHGPLRIWQLEFPVRPWSFPCGDCHRQKSSHAHWWHMPPINRDQAFGMSPRSFRGLFFQWCEQLIYSNCSTTIRLSEAVVSNGRLSKFNCPSGLCWFMELRNTISFFIPESTITWASTKLLDNYDSLNLDQLFCHLYASSGYITLLYIVYKK